LSTPSPVAFACPMRTSGARATPLTYCAVWRSSALCRRRRTGLTNYRALPREAACVNSLCGRIFIAPHSATVRVARRRGCSPAKSTIPHCMHWSSAQSAPHRRMSKYRDENECCQTGSRLSGDSCWRDVPVRNGCAAGHCSIANVSGWLGNGPSCGKSGEAAWGRHTPLAELVNWRSCASFQTTK
jgi:hypothetical protein